MTGTLKMNGSPLELLEGILRVGEKEVHFVIGHGGEFYIEDISPGVYEGSVIIKDKVHRFVIKIPELKDPVINVGDVHVETD